MPTCSIQGFCILCPVFKKKFFFLLLLLLNNTALDLTVSHSLYGCLQIGLLVCCTWRIFQWRELLGKLSVSGKWGSWVIDRMSSLVTYASSDSPQCRSVLLWITGSDHYWHCYQNKYQILIAKTSTYLITSFQTEKIRILVYFVLACTSTCWNSVINNCYTCWLPVPCQSFVPKISCNFHNSDDKVGW